MDYASLVSLLGASCPTRADAPHSLTTPQALEAISIAPSFVQTMLSAMLRAERWPTARLSHLSTADSILMSSRKEEGRRIPGLVVGPGVAKVEMLAKWFYASKCQGL